MFEIGGNYYIRGETFEVLNIIPNDFEDPELVLFDSGTGSIIYRNESDFLPEIFASTGKLFGE